MKITFSSVPRYHYNGNSYKSVKELEEVETVRIDQMLVTYLNKQAMLLMNKNSIMRGTRPEHFYAQIIGENVSEIEKVIKDMKIKHEELQRAMDAFCNPIPEELNGTEINSSVDKEQGGI